MCFIWVWRAFNEFPHRKWTCWTNFIFCVCIKLFFFPSSSSYREKLIFKRYSTAFSIRLWQPRRALPTTLKFCSAFAMFRRTLFVFRFADGERGEKEPKSFYNFVQTWTSPSLHTRLFCGLYFAGEEKFVSSNYVIENMDRHKGGTYICTANNGVGQTASSQIALHVLCK